MLSGFAIRHPGQRRVSLLVDNNKSIVQQVGNKYLYVMCGIKFRSYVRRMYITAG